jgi:hypothetical protein
MAASEGTVFTTNEKGEVVASNNGNGADSNNTTNVTQTTDNTTVQNNNAVIENTLDLSANTGNNQASMNTGGDSNIITGDANIIANMINFVNNNVTGNGKLFVTVVNVFGSWLGNFVTPGQHKEVTTGQLATQQSSQQQTNIGGANITTQSTEATQQQTTVVVASQEHDEEYPVPTISMRTRNISYIRGTSQHNSYIEESENLELPTFYGEEAGDATMAQAITTQVAGKKVVSINLAWLIFLIPGVILLVAARKVRKALHRMPR